MQKSVYFYVLKNVANKLTILADKNLLFLPSVTIILLFLVSWCWRPWLNLRKSIHFVEILLQQSQNVLIGQLLAKADARG